MNIILLGPPGSGKSRQARFVSKHLGVPRFSMGGLCRRVAGKKTELGKRIKKIMERGGLVSDKDILTLVKNSLVQPRYQRGFIIEGFPRNLNQAKKFLEKIDKVFYLDTSDKVGIERIIKRGRPDDKLSVIKKRVVVYHKETEPVLDFYRKKGNLVKIDGEQSEKEVYQDILSHVKMKI